MTQFSLFGAAATAPALADLGGILLAGGHWVRGRADDVTSDVTAGAPAGARTTARLSVVVRDEWRALALADGFADRDLAGDAPQQAPTGLTVRTAFAASLAPLADAWTRGANEAPPAGFILTAGGLRLWAIAAGRYDEVGYLLGTALPDDEVHRVAGAQLARLGLAAVSIHRGGAGWRVTSARRLRRLHELLGPAPEGGAGNWPLSG
ncbi:MAG: hypothetical protein EPN43_09415 [Jatrophihabitans sp.]|nr:MAG: hypothetical protein EPN43_09415 [Jatrophihabitans sp.]